MNPIDTQLEPQIFKIIKSHLKEGVSKMQIDSFDDFVHTKMDQIFEKEISITLQRGEKYNLTFSQPHLSSPHIIDEGRKLREIYPNEARLRNLHYESTLSVNITEKVYNEKEDVEEVKNHIRIELAKLPIML